MPLRRSDEGAGTWQPMSERNAHRAMTSVASGDCRSLRRNFHEESGSMPPRRSDEGTGTWQLQVLSAKVYKG
jgi:hypothetical protein